MHKKKIIVDENTGEVIDANTGRVLEEKLSVNQKIITDESDGEKPKGHHGKRQDDFTHDRGLTTEIVNSNRDFEGRKISSETSNNFIRLRKWQDRTRVHGSRETRLVHYLTILDSWCQTLKTPMITRTQASEIIRTLIVKKSLKNVPADALIGSVLYYAAKQTGNVISLKEIKNRVIAKRKILHYLELVKDAIGPTDSKMQEYRIISKTCNNLHINFATQKLALRIIDAVHQLGKAGGKNPNTVSGYALFQACSMVESKKINSKITQEEIVDALGISAESIRHCRRDMGPALELVKTAEELKQKVKGLRGIST